MIENNQDIDYLNIALDEAIKRGNRGNVPIGAVLVIDGKIIGVAGNNQVNDKNYFSHAESLLIGRYSREIKKAHKNSLDIILYTTLEPCLMCFGTAVHNRVKRIVFSCPDPAGGATHLKPITEWYAQRWPSVDGGKLKEKSVTLLLDYMRKNADEWKNCLTLFEKMVSEWTIN